MNRKKNKAATGLVLAGLLILVSAFPVFSGGRQEAPSDVGVRVFVSVLPQTWFVEKIGGERVSIDVMVPPGRNPATYEPTPNQVTSLSAADVFFSIGVPFERLFIPKIAASLKGLKIADTSAGIELRMIENHGHDKDDHKDEEGAPDPHIWLSPVLVKKQAENIYNTLVQLDPEGREVYTAGLKSLKAEMDQLDAEIKTILDPYRGSTFFVFHPTFGYFADRYGLKQVAVETGGKEPSPSELQEIVEHAAEEKVKIIFAQPEFSRDSVKAIADAIDGRVVILNPLDPDYVNNMKRIAEEIKRAYE